MMGVFVCLVLFLGVNVCVVKGRVSFRGKWGLSDNEKVFLKFVVGDFEIEGRWSLPDTS